MNQKANTGPSYLLALLVLLQGGCFSEGDPAGAGQCGPRDLTPECCLKENPGQWERCTGMSELEARSLSLGGKTLVVGTAVLVAAGPVTLPSERRGVALAVDLRRKVEQAIAQCARRADRQVNDFHLNGQSPTRELCEKLRVEQQKWSAYLGLLKHEESWPCLRLALDELVPGRYLLHPRFQFNPQKGKWEYMDPNLVSQIVHRHGWKGLTGTIEPDIVILDANGVILLVYDLKFPCPETNPAKWDVYADGPWQDKTQGQIYYEALNIQPLLVSPKYGVGP